MKKVLFIASHRQDRAPGQRFRFEQYFEFLGKNGYQCELSWLLDERDDIVFYSKGKVLQKAAILMGHYRKRMQDLHRLDDFDIVFVFREALMTRSLYFERKFSSSRAKMIFDFDDAIWLNDTSEANRLFRWMKRPSKIEDIIGMSHMVFAGNGYLADFAKRYNQAVHIVPTTIDTSVYVKHKLPQKIEKIVIGWSGSITTIKHFEHALPFLRIIHQRFQDRIAIRVIGDGTYRNEDLGIQGLPWKKETEVEDLSMFDIGIMPLPDDEWARGKCGLKGLQYMALGIPTIMSPVGVNKEIITDGENGFLANSVEEWVDKLSLLIENAELAKKVGEAARETVLTRYSVEAIKYRYLELFDLLLRS